MNETEIVPIPEELLGRLMTATMRDGPFTDWSDDQPVLKGVLAWVDGDWQRLRMLLNFVFERGEQAATRLAVNKLMGLQRSTDYRLTTLWLRDLTRGSTNVPDPEVKP